MTAHVFEEERNRCSLSGMDDYISKPIEPEVLFTTLRRWIPVRDTSAPTGVFPDLEGVDTRSGLARVAGNAELYRSLLIDIAGQQAVTAADLETAFRDGASALVSQLAHTLRGVAGNLGLMSIQQKAGDLERAARQKTETRQLLDALLHELQSVSDQILEGLRSEPSPPPTSATAPGSAVLETFAQQLQGFDGQAIATLPEALRALGNVADPAELKELELLVRSFELERALAQLCNLLAR